MDISIIIPTLNRARLLQLTLESILIQDSIAGTFEVIVVDNGSVDDTKKVCEEYQKQFTHFIYCYDAMPGQLTGRHKGYQLAGGEILCYLDDDVQLNSGWLKAIYELSQKHPSISIFGGPSLPRYEVKPPTWVNRFWTATPFGGKACLPLSLIDLDTEEMLISPLYIFGLNFSIRKKTLEALKGFNPDCIPASLQKYQGDGETGLAIKAVMNQEKALFSSRLTLQHQVPAERLTPGYFSKWSFYNGVCQSFTDLRFTHKLYRNTDVKQEKRAVSPGITAKIAARILGYWSRWFRNSREINRLMDAVTEAYHKGYEFHQDAFKEDQKVRDWVLRSDYLSYALPA